MRRNIPIVVAAFITLLTLWTGTAAAQVCPGESTWKNQRGSTLHIEDIDTEGKITGYYINKAKGYACQGTPYPVTGWVLEGTNTITFAVKWENTVENCSSITAWTGFFNKDCDRLTALWQLVINGATDPSQIIKGMDTFTRVTQTQSDFIKKK